MTIDWKNLGFDYMETNCHVRYTWRDGQWDKGELVESPYLNLHIAATCIHYGQACFEGLKAFHGKDGKVRIFRPADNAQRMNSSASRTLMANVPEELFIEATKRVVKANSEFIPPYESGGALYIRPLLIGSGPKIGVQPSAEYTLIILVTPVGNYYKGGLKPVAATIIEGFDRSAPGGTGDVKIAGNYAASLMASSIAQKQGFPINLYLDSKEHRFIDEFGTSNFIAIKGNSYITPDSKMVLPSITNKSLMTIAEDQGMTIERRGIELDEVKEFDAVGACGTAVVITPVAEIHTEKEVISISGDTVHPILHQLYDKITDIQRGIAEDKYNWCVTLDA